MGEEVTNPTNAQLSNHAFLTNARLQTDVSKEGILFIPLLHKSALSRCLKP